MEQDSKQQRITEAALQLFSEQGYHQTTVSQIAAEAGVAKGTVYWYFESKQDLFQGILLTGVEELNQQILAQVESDQPPLAKLEAVISLYLDFFVDCQEVSKMYEENTSGIDPEFKQQLIDLRQTAVDLIAQILDEGQAAGLLKEGLVSREAANLLLGMISVYNPHFSPDNQISSAKTKVVKDLFLEGARA